MWQNLVTKHDKINEDIQEKGQKTWLIQVLMCEDK